MQNLLHAQTHNSSVRTNRDEVPYRFTHDIPNSQGAMGFQPVDVPQETQSSSVSVPQPRGQTYTVIPPTSTVTEQQSQPQNGTDNRSHCTNMPPF